MAEEYIVNGSIIGGIMAGVYGVVKWAIGRSIKETDEKLQAHANELKAHAGLHSETALSIERMHRHLAENYAPRVDLNAARIEMNKGLDRVHGRIDDVGGKLEKRVDDVMNTVTDIKTLLAININNPLSKN